MAPSTIAPPNGANHEDDDDEGESDSQKHSKMNGPTNTKQMATLQEFLGKLEDAAEGIMKAGRVYDRVSCLVTFWDDGDRTYLKEHGKRLWDVFRDEYGFETGDEPLALPTAPGSDPNDALVEAIRDRVNPKAGGVSDPNSNNLFILYYGGHASKNKNGAIWQSKKKGGSVVEWGPCQALLKDKQCDLLFLFDCCYGGAMIDSDRKWRQRC